jgi:hypothetical protein
MAGLNENSLSRIIQPSSKLAIISANISDTLALNHAKKIYLNLN